MKNRKETHEIFWFNFITDISKDIFEAKKKTFLKASVISHCKSYADLTNRSKDNIKIAADKFFKQV